MWTVAGALTVVSFIVSMPGQALMGNFLTTEPQQVIIEQQK